MSNLGLLLFVVVVAAAALALWRRRAPMTAGRSYYITQQSGGTIFTAVYNPDNNTSQMISANQGDPTVPYAVPNKMTFTVGSAGAIVVAGATDLMDNPVAGFAGKSVILNTNYPNFGIFPALGPVTPSTPACVWEPSAPGSLTGAVTATTPGSQKYYMCMRPGGNIYADTMPTLKALEWDKYTKLTLVPA